VPRPPTEGASAAGLDSVLRRFLSATADRVGSRRTALARMFFGSPFDPPQTAGARVAGAHVLRHHPRDRRRP